MTPKRRAQLKRAQAISARKRRLAPNKRVPVGSSRRRPQAITTARVTKRGISKRRIALGIGAVAAVGAGAYVARRHQNISHYKRERALIRKHRKKYLPPTVNVYHHTFRQGHRNILGTQHFRHLGRHHNKQNPDRVWFTSSGSQREMDTIYGEYQVKIRRVKRSHIADIGVGYGVGFAGRRVKGEARTGWLSIKREHLSGYKVEHHVAPKANPVHGTKAQRARAARIRSARRRLTGARFAVNGRGIASLVR